MEESRSRVEMAIIQSDHRVPATYAASEHNRENDAAQAILMGGGATVAAAVRLPRSLTIGASSLCLANGLSSPNFTPALRDLGTAGSDERSPNDHAGRRQYFLAVQSWLSCHS
jgi:hypothetical protein